MILRFPILAFFVWLSLYASVADAAISLENLRMWHSPGKSRLVFDLSDPVGYKVYDLANPLRLVVDLDNAVFNGVLPSSETVGPYIQRIRKGTPKPGVLRIVLDLKKSVTSEIIVLSPNDLYGHRLVIDIASREATSRPDTATGQSSPAIATTPQPSAGPLVIAIDAGHGGEDPGAIGGRKTLEKHVVMAIARKLKALIDRHPGLQGRMTREGDYYISLRERTQLARSHHADLFVSIHADGFYNRDARGMSVYALSNKGATSEAAKWLANKENSSDLVGGVSLHDKDDLLAQVLLDLSMTKTVSDGIGFARFVLTEIRKLGPVHSRRVEQAGFAVLKSPDIPSILVETGYITNPREEQLLRTSAYQEELANAIYRGVISYLNAQGLLPKGRDQVHLVSSGENLSVVALRYGISVSDLKRHNGLSNSRIFVGQKLKIPARGG